MDAKKLWKRCDILTVAGLLLFSLNMLAQHMDIVKYPASWVGWPSDFLTGVGAGLVLIGVARRLLTMWNPEYKKQQDVSANEERELAIRDKSFAIAFKVMTYALCAAGAVFAAFEQHLGLFLTVGIAAAGVSAKLIAMRRLRKLM